MFSLDENTNNIYFMYDCFIIPKGESASWGRTIEKVMEIRGLKKIESLAVDLTLLKPDEMTEEGFTQSDKINVIKEIAQEDPYGLKKRKKGHDR